MRFMKSCIATLVAAMFVAFVLAGCSAAQSSGTVKQTTASSEGSVPAASIEGLKKDGMLTVGVRSSASAPFVIGSGDSISGLDVDLGASLASELNLKASFVSVDDVGKALQETCDVVINVTSSEANGFDVVGDYAETGYAFFHRGETKVSTVDEISGKSVAVQQGSSSQMALKVTSLSMNEVTFSSLNESFEALKSSTVDYVLCQSCSGAYLTAWQEKLAFAGLMNEPTAQGIALASGDGAVAKAVREAYEKMNDNGVLSEVRRSWLGNCPKLTSESVIKDIPMKETNGEPLSNSLATQEVLQTAQDGSTAGANAVTPAEARALGATQQGTSGDQGGETQSQVSETQSQNSQSQSQSYQSQSYQSQPYQSQSYEREYTDYSPTYEDSGQGSGGSANYSESTNYNGYYDNTEAYNGSYDNTEASAQTESIAVVNPEPTSQNTNGGNGGDYTESSVN